MTVPGGRGPLLAGVVGVAAVLGFRALGLAWPDVAALVALLVILPVLSVVQVGALGDTEIERMPAYLSSIVSLGVLGAAAAGVGWRHGGASALGLVGLPWGAFLTWTGGLVAGGLLVTGLFRQVGMTLGMREAPLLRSLLPVTERERLAFGGLSVAAGVGEELAYRGYVMGVLGGIVGGPWAAVISSLVFGLLHVYQGPLGILRTATLGGLLAWGFLATGSLWPSIVAHAALDVLLGIFLAERMMVPPDPSGVST